MRRKYFALRACSKILHSLVCVCVCVGRVAVQQKLAQSGSSLLACKSSTCWLPAGLFDLLHPRAMARGACVCASNVIEYDFCLLPMLTLK